MPRSAAQVQHVQPSQDEALRRNSRGQPRFAGSVWPPLSLQADALKNLRQVIFPLHIKATIVDGFEPVRIHDAPFLQRDFALICRLLLRNFENYPSISMQ